MTSNSNIFNQALKNLQDKPAAYTIMALLIVLGLILGNKFLDERLRFWIMVIIFVIIAILLIVTLEPFNKDKYINVDEKHQPIIHNETNQFYKLINTSLICENMHYHIEFKELDSNGIWIHLKVSQKLKNNTDLDINRPFKINHYNKTVRNEVVKINSVPIVTNNQPEFITNKGLSIDYSIKSKDFCEIVYSSEILYAKKDSDFFGTLIPANRIEFIIINSLNGMVNDFNYTLDKQFTVVSGYFKMEEENNTKHIILENGVLPFNGVLIKWNINQ